MEPSTLLVYVDVVPVVVAGGGGGGGLDRKLAILRLFNSISFISGRLAGDDERLCAMEPRLRLGRYRL